MSSPRVFITTDMQMISGVNLIDGDKDDVQSMIHALLYQDKYDIVGIASSTSYWQPGKNNADLVHKVIDTYAKDQAKLEARDDGFKTAAELHDMVYQGTRALAGKSGLVAANEASRAIIEAARDAADDGVPLYVTAWGGLGDIARALHDAPDIADTVRLLSVAGKTQEPKAYAYLKANFAGKGDLWWIDEQNTHKGVYGTPDSKNPIDGWSVTNAKGHGALGDMFYDNTLDIRGTVGNVDGMKMGDSHTIFYLIDKADDNNPTAESWGGEYKLAGTKYWVDRTDNSFNWENSNGARTIYEDRAAWTSDFAARLDWLKGASTVAPPPAPSKPTVPDNAAIGGGKTGTSGNDSMLGTSASDTLSGGAGNDMIDGAGGNDRMIGGTGNDVYYVRQSGDVVVENAGEGTDMVHAFVSHVLASNVENMDLRSAGNINGTGNMLANKLNGNSGANTLDGKAGNDVINGNGGNDRIIGGAGNDTLTGGAGDDLFIFNVGDGNDVITDFVAGAKLDRLQFNGIDRIDSKTQVGNDTMIKYGGDSVLLKNVDVEDLTGADFIFA